MLNYAKLGLYLILISVLCSCEGERKGDEIRGEVFHISPDPLGPADPLPYDSVIQTISFVPLETNEHNLLSEITKTRVADNQIYILDRQQRVLFIFSVKGKFLKRINPGEGPTDANDIIDFTLDDQGDITILGNRALFLFNKAGEFIKKIEIDFNYDFIEYAHPIFIAYLKGEYFLWAGSIGKKYLKERPDYAMYKLDKNYKIKEKYFVIKRPLAETWRFQEFSDSLFIIPTYLGDTVFKATPESSVEARFLVDFGDRAISKHNNARNSTDGESLIAYELGNSTNLCMGIRNFLVMPDHIYFQYRCGNLGYHFFYNKNTGSKRGGRFDYEESPMFSPTGVYKNQLIFYTEAARIVQEVSNLKGKNSWPDYLRDKVAQLDSVKRDHNPVLSFVTLKDF